MGKMKTKHYLIAGALAILGITSFVACEKSDIAPSQATSEVTSKKGKPITVPCPANYPEVVLPARYNVTPVPCNIDMLPVP